MIAAAAAWVAKSALMQSPIGGFLKAVPKQVWIALAIALAIFTAVKWHGHEAHAATDAAYRRGKAEVEAYYAAKSGEWIQRIGQIASKRKEINREENRRIVAHADTLRLSGPGKAACPYATPAVPGGRSDAASGPVDAGLDRVPDQRGPAFAAVPFDDLVTVGQYCTLNRQEVIDRRAAEKALQDAWAREQGAGATKAVN